MHLHPTLAAALVAAAMSATASPAPPAGSAPSSARGDEAPWTVVGRQGLVLQVIVPTALARDEAAYTRQIPLICGERPTCFVNFYTNSTGAAATLPLPEAISNESTAILRRSEKQQAEGIRFSCRLQLAEPGCF